MDIILWVIAFGAVFHQPGGAGGPYSISLESSLRTGLFTGYEVLQRPSQLVRVKIAFNLITINALDIKDQALSTTGFFEMAWIDRRLEWKLNSTYDNIIFIFSSEAFTWRPAVIIENSALDLKVFSDINTLIRVISTGRAYWTPGGVFTTYCEADITYYPLDTQECRFVIKLLNSNRDLKIIDTKSFKLMVSTFFHGPNISVVLSTWAYTSGEVTLDFGDEPYILDNFKENGEWEIIETSTVSASTTKPGGSSYSRLYFNLKLRRRPLFHIINTIFPVILMASLIVFVFKLPPESGERVGMSLTVLLAYTVYLSLISESIPKTSVSASILSVYLTIILMLSALSVIFTIIVLDIYFNDEDDEDIPTWVQTITRRFLVKVSMWKGTSCCGKQVKVTPDRSASDAVVLTDIESPANGKNNKILAEPFSGINTMDDNKSVRNDDSDEKMYSWKEIALILDKCFMYLFIFLVMSCTFTCMAILGFSY